MSQPPFFVQIDQVGTSELRGTIRSHQVIVDRPLPKGGTDLGPLGGEYLLIALGGCFLSNLLAAARARGEELSKTRVVVTATTAESPPRFSGMQLRVAVALQNRDLVRKLLEIAEHACLVTNTLKATMPISIDIDGEP
jgi:putative redox protein